MKVVFDWGWLVGKKDIMEGKKMIEGMKEWDKVCWEIVGERNKNMVWEDGEESEISFCDMVEDFGELMKDEMERGMDIGEREDMVEVMRDVVKKYDLEWECNGMELRYYVKRVCRGLRILMGSEWNMMEVCEMFWEEMEFKGEKEKLLRFIGRLLMMMK